MTTTAKVGGEVEAQCGRCHDATVHKVLAMEKNRPKRVQCNGCEAQHLYRKPKGPEEPRSKRKAGPKRDPNEVAYEKALKGATDGEPVPYLIGNGFKEGQRLKHQSFGEGIVTRVIRPQVIEVTFKDGMRKMAMNR